MFWFAPDNDSDLVSDFEGVPDATDEEKDVPLDSPCAYSEQAKDLPDGEEFSEPDYSLDGNVVADNIEVFFP